MTQDLSWIEECPPEDAMVLSRLWRETGIEKLAVADMLLARAVTATSNIPDPKSGELKV